MSCSLWPCAVQIKHQSIALLCCNNVSSATKHLFRNKLLSARKENLLRVKWIFPVCSLSPPYNPGGLGGRISLCRCHADSSPQQAQLSSATDLNSHHSDLGYCNFKNTREEECSIKENKVLQYKRQNCHLGDYHPEMLQALFCQD